MDSEINITRVRNIVRECHVIASDLAIDKRLPSDLRNSVIVLNDLINTIYCADWHINTF